MLMAFIKLLVSEFIFVGLEFVRPVVRHLWRGAWTKGLSWVFPGIVLG